MRKQWLGICIAAGLLAACSSDDVQQKTVSTRLNHTSLIT
ncbi:hypothetical protein, partial [Klebsiella pneumoniae]